MYPSVKQKNSLSYGDPKVAPLVPRTKVAMVKTTRNGVPAKMRKEEYNEDINIKSEKPKKDNPVKKYPHELRTTFNKKWMN